jgi:type IV pilus assembly protein PilW
MMIALTITMIVVAAAWSLTMHVRNLYLMDQARTTLNQNLRGGMEVMAADIRQAGERLPTDPLNPNNILPLTIINGTSGASDEVIMRRNILDAVLPVCMDIHGGSNQDNVKIADSGPHPAPGCSPVPDLNGDGWPDNLEEWRNYRLNNGGSVRIYVYDPVTGDGEFVTYDAEDGSQFKIHKTHGAWQHDYPDNHNPRVYMLEERRYFRNGNRLRLQLNGSVNYDVTTDVTDFQAQALMNDGSVLNSVSTGVNWLDVEAIRITLDGQTTVGKESYSGSLSMQLFPRNILSN